MRIKNKGFTLIELLIVVAILGTVAAFVVPILQASIKKSKVNSNTGGGVTSVVKGSYSPPILPVTISISSNGTLQVGVSGSLKTPFGSFSAEWERKKIYYLEITLGNQTRFYPLGNNKFKIYLPNSMDGDTSIRYDGEGNVRILVPNPGRIRFPS